jgi:carboxymethylenebutenolidase
MACGRLAGTITHLARGASGVRVVFASRPGMRKGVFVTQRSVQVETPDGVCTAALSVPVGEGPWPAVVMFHDAGGMRDAMRQMGERLSALGYLVLVPDIYYRNGPYAAGDAPGARSKEAEEKLLAMMWGYKADMAVKDAAAMIDYLDSRPEKKPGGVGTTGYCLGGWISMHAAGSLGERVAAAASFHAPNLALDGYRGSPHHKAADIKAHVYVAGAVEDEVFPDEQKALLERLLTEAAVAHVIETYPARHGFAVPDNASYDIDAAERHWNATEQLFASVLGH